ncbi:MAG: hypothetical protein ACPGUD_13055 [Parashewanella sp.]
MKYLTQGHESKERIELLLKLTNIRSKAIKKSLISHFVDGVPARMAYVSQQVDQPNFARSKKRLESVASIVEEIKELDLEKQK